MRQRADRQKEMKAGTFQSTAVDEMNAIRHLAAKIFGDSDTQYDWPNGPQPKRYGGLLEGGPKEPGILYMGFFTEPPTRIMHKRARMLLFIGAKHSEFVAQAKLMGMPT